MRHIIVQEFISIDGVMQAPGDPSEYSRGGWQRQFVCPEQLDRVTQLMLQADALLLGRKTYESFAAAWPAMKGLRGMADRINAMPKLVASTTLTDPRWNATVIQGDLAQAVNELKRQDGNSLLVLGSGALVRFLAKHDLINEYELWIHPVIVGDGERLFPDGLDTSVWALAGTQVTPTGQVVLTYRRSS
jgi:dihydrofolate reductase